MNAVGGLVVAVLRTLVRFARTFLCGLWDAPLPINVFRNDPTNFDPKDPSVTAMAGSQPRVFKHALIYLPGVNQRAWVWRVIVRDLALQFPKTLIVAPRFDYRSLSEGADDCVDRVMKLLPPIPIAAVVGTSAGARLAYALAQKNVAPHAILIAGPMRGSGWVEWLPRRLVAWKCGPALTTQMERGLPRVLAESGYENVRYQCFAADWDGVVWPAERTAVEKKTHVLFGHSHFTVAYATEVWKAMQSVMSPYYCE